jgi:hypothetical protein
VVNTPVDLQRNRLGHGASLWHRLAASQQPPPALAGLSIFWPRSHR